MDENIKNMNESQDVHSDGDTPDKQEEINDTDQKEGKGSVWGKNKYKKRIDELEEQLGNCKNDHVRLLAEFDNFRKRIARERIDLLQNASRDLIVELLPVVDDFERAQQSIVEAEDMAAVRQGMDLVYNKLIKILQQKGLKPMESHGEPFDSELHEAITEIPAPSADMKGKVVEEIEKGYYLNDRIIRHAKVIVGK